MRPPCRQPEPAARHRRRAAWVLLGLLLAAAFIRGPAALTPAHWIVGILALGLLRASDRRRAVA